MTDVSPATALIGNAPPPLISRKRAEQAVPERDCSGTRWDDYFDGLREDIIRFVICGAEIQRDHTFYDFQPPTALPHYLSVVSREALDNLRERLDQLPEGLAAHWATVLCDAAPPCPGLVRLPEGFPWTDEVRRELLERFSDPGQMTDEAYEAWAALQWMIATGAKQEKKS